MTKLSENAENYLNNRFSALKDRRKKEAEEKKMQQKKRMQQIIREINEHANYEDEKCETFLQLQQELKEAFQKSPNNKTKQQRILTDITNVFSEICISYPEISEQFFGGSGAEDIAGSIEMLLCSAGPINELLQALGADFIEEMRQSLLVSSPEPSANMPEPDQP